MEFALYAIDLAIVHHHLNDVAISTDLPLIKVPQALVFCLEARACAKVLFHVYDKLQVAPVDILELDLQCGMHRPHQLKGQRAAKFLEDDSLIWLDKRANLCNMPFELSLSQTACMDRACGKWHNFMIDGLRKQVPLEKVFPLEEDCHLQHQNSLVERAQNSYEASIFRCECLSLLFLTL